MPEGLEQEELVGDVRPLRSVSLMTRANCFNYSSHMINNIPRAVLANRDAIVG